MTTGNDAPVRRESRAVVVTVAYPPMCRMITQLLERDRDPWRVTSTSMADLARAIQRHDPDALIVDAADFPRCCRLESGGFPAARVVVIGRDPDHAYRTAAVRGGAGAWVAADAIGDQLSAELDAGFVCARADNLFD